MSLFAIVLFLLIERVINYMNTIKCFTQPTHWNGSVIDKNVVKEIVMIVECTPEVSAIKLKQNF